MKILGPTFCNWGGGCTGFPPGYAPAHNRGTWSEYITQVKCNCINSRLQHNSLRRGDYIQFLQTDVMYNQNVPDGFGKLVFAVSTWPTALGSCHLVEIEFSAFSNENKYF